MRPICVCADIAPVAAYVAAPNALVAASQRRHRCLLRALRLAAAPSAPPRAAGAARPLRAITATAAAAAGERAWEEQLAVEVRKSDPVSRHAAGHTAPLLPL